MNKDDSVSVWTRSVSVWNRISDNEERARAFWVGRFFAVSEPVRPYDPRDIRYAITHLITGGAVFFSRNKRQAFAIAKALDASDPKVWGSKRWRMGKRPSQKSKLAMTAYDLFEKVRGQVVGGKGRKVALGQETLS